VRNLLPLFLLSLALVSGPAAAGEPLDGEWRLAHSRLAHSREPATVRLSIRDGAIAIIGSCRAVSGPDLLAKERPAPTAPIELEASCVSEPLRAPL
jgi:hypothetical protein